VGALLEADRHSFRAALLGGGGAGCDRGVGRARETGCAPQLGPPRKRAARIV
ncbi:MAG: hypothetical protein QOF33_3217, partial [Thermomicrobiales bacterium]|nr:hypothetical protein [Thermomicrobiales bacterium]